MHRWVFGLISLKLICMTEFLRAQILDECADEQEIQNVKTLAYLLWQQQEKCRDC